MPKRNLHRILIAFFLAIPFVQGKNDVFAYKQFQDRWQDVYLEEHPDQEFAKMCEKEVKCYVCHQGKKKHHNNAYGELFEGKLTKKDRKDKEKIIRVIKEIGLLKSDPEQAESPTYNEIIASGELPGGDLEELKKEPEDG